MNRLLTTVLISIGVLGGSVFAIAAYLTTAFIAVVAFAGVIALGMLMLLADWGRRRYIAWRERRDMTVRNAQLRKWNIGAFRGAKKTDVNRFLS